MKITGLTWARTGTAEYSAMVRIFRDVLGLQLVHERYDIAMFRMANGETVEVMGPSDVHHRHFDAGPVVGFRVNDVATARAELEVDREVELVGPLGSWPGCTASRHFRAPNRQVYEVLGPLNERERLVGFAAPRQPDRNFSPRLGSFVQDHEAMLGIGNHSLSGVRRIQTAQIGVVLSTVACTLGAPVIMSSR